GRFGSRAAEVGGVEDGGRDDAEAAVGIRPLRHDADAPPHHRRLGDDVRAGNDGLAAGDAHARREDADRRRLAGAVRPEHPEQLAVVDGEIERVDGDYVRGIDLAERTGFDGWHWVR